MGTISFIPKLKRQELNRLQKRAYSALEYMQTARRAFSLRGCCSHLLSSGRCFAPYCHWAERQHTLEKASTQCYNGLGMTTEGRDTWVRFLAASQMWCRAARSLPVSSFQQLSFTGCWLVIHTFPCEGFEVYLWRYTTVETWFSTRKSDTPLEHTECEMEVMRYTISFI